MEPNKNFPEVCLSQFWEEKEPKTFVKLKTPVFRNVRFYRPIGSQKNDLINSTVIVKTNRTALKLHAEVIKTRYDKKIAPKNFYSTGKIAFLSKNCIYNNLFGITEKIS